MGWVGGRRGEAGGGSLAALVEPAFAVLVRLASSGDTAARAHAMGSLGAVQILTEVLLAATECGVALPHGQELGVLLAQAARK